MLWHEFIDEGGCTLDPIATRMILIQVDHMDLILLKHLRILNDLFQFTLVVLKGLLS